MLRLGKPPGREYVLHSQRPIEQGSGQPGRNSRGWRDCGLTPPAKPTTRNKRHPSTQSLQLVNSLPIGPDPQRRRSQERFQDPKNRDGFNPSYLLRPAAGAARVAGCSRGRPRGTACTAEESPRSEEASASTRSASCRRWPRGQGRRGPCRGLKRRELIGCMDKGAMIKVRILTLVGHRRHGGHVRHRGRAGGRGIVSCVRRESVLRCACARQRQDQEGGQGGGGHRGRRRGIGDHERATSQFGNLGSDYGVRTNLS